MSIEEVGERLAAIRARIGAAADRAGRRPEEVQLIAVSKGHPASAIRAAFVAGQRDFGENYAQELLEKASELSDLTDLSFHFVGQLQRNKARDVARVARSVHAVDRESLAIELSRRTPPDRSLAVYIEVNVSGEASKGGCTPEALPVLIECVEDLPNLDLRGLMTMPPAGDDPETTRPFFGTLRTIRDRAAEAHPTLTGLSMGMTDDFEIAIAEGATVVRVGTAIFGPRPERRP